MTTPADDCPPDLNDGPALRIIAMPKDANPSGDIFGGWIMAMMDLAGARDAIRLAGGRVATVAVESMQFVSPVFIGDEVSLFSSVERVGTTSVTVRVVAWVCRGRGGEPHKVTEAVLTYVALGEDRRPRPVNQRPG